MSETTNAGGGELYDKLMALRLEAAEFADEAADNTSGPTSAFEAKERGRASAFYEAAELVKTLTAPSPEPGGVAAEPVAGETDVSEGVVAEIIAAYRNARAKYGATSEEASVARGSLYDLEELCRHLAAAPTPAAGGGETERPASKIIAGMKDAVAFAQGDESRGRIVHPSPASPAGDLAALSAGAPKGPYRVEYAELGEGPDTRPIAFLMGPNDEYLLVDEEPKDFVDGAPSPILTYLAELDAAYRSGRLVEAAPAAPRKGPSEEEIARALYEHDVPAPRFLWPIQNERMAANYRSRARAVLALLTPADRGETRAERDGVRADQGGEVR